MKKQLVQTTSNAVAKIKELMQSRETFPKGLRVSLRTKGCSGLSWDLEFIDEVNKFDEQVVVDSDLSLFIDPKAVMFVIGSQINYIQTELEEGFVFENPNEKSKCGCGESFTV